MQIKITYKLYVKLEEYDVKALHRLRIRNNNAVVILKLNNKDKRSQLIVNAKKKKQMMSV